MNRAELFKCLNEEFGLNVTKRQIKRWIFEDKIPHVRLNKRTVQFPRRLILPWIERRTKSAA